MSDAPAQRPPYLLGSLLAVLGAIGLWAAFQLTLEKFHALEHPDDALSCDFSLVVQCMKNLTSPQGSVFGFPNPVIGLVCWAVVITVAVGLLAGARYAKWFWIGLNVGMIGALVFVIWLMGQSIFVLSTLCPWCMVTWAVVIPSFWIVTLHNLRAGNIPTTASVQRFAAKAYGWIPLITIVCYVIVAIVAQVQLEWTRTIRF